MLDILVAGGTEVPVSTPIAIVGELGEEYTSTSPADQREGASSVAEHAAPANAIRESPGPVEQVAERARALSSPRARRLAKEKGVALHVVRGSGPGGSIVERDVSAWISEHQLEGRTLDSAGSLGTANRLGSATQPNAMRLPAESAVPRHRQVIAQRLTQAVQTIPHIVLTAAVDMRRARANLARGREAGLDELTYTHLLLRALARALRAYPAVNRVWRTGGGGTQYQAIAGAPVGLAVAGGTHC